MRDWEPIKVICSEATAGEWRSVQYDNTCFYICGENVLDKYAPGRSLATVYYLNEGNRSDADFITTARTALPDAITEIEQLRQEKAELVEMLKSVSQHTGYIDLINDELEAILAKHGGEPK